MIVGHYHNLGEGLLKEIAVVTITEIGSNCIFWQGSYDK
jgi:hypothetical protein